MKKLFSPDQPNFYSEHRAKHPQSVATSYLLLINNTNSTKHKVASEYMHCLMGSSQQQQQQQQTSAILCNYS